MSVKVAGVEKPSNCVQINVIGVAEIGKSPAKRFDGGVGGRSRRGRLGADDGMFAVRFIPDWITSTPQSSA